jgi:hypothetical protein
VITVLVVGQAVEAYVRAAAGLPSIEILAAVGAEDALEKLARNRRIDAVLLVAGDASRQIAGILREEDPAGPPIFATAGERAVPGATSLKEADPHELLERIRRELSGGG